MACHNTPMRALLIPVAAVLVGLAGGYAWSSLGAGPAKPKPPRATQIAPPPSPEELPTAEDRQWTAEATDTNVYYSGCNEVRAAGKAPLHADDPGYRSDMDGDNDGLACEPIRY